MSRDNPQPPSTESNPQHVPAAPIGQQQHLTHAQLQPHLVFCGGCPQCETLGQQPSNPAVMEQMQCELCYMQAAHHHHQHAVYPPSTHPPGAPFAPRQTHPHHVHAIPPASFHYPPHQVYGPHTFHSPVAHAQYMQLQAQQQLGLIKPPAPPSVESVESASAHTVPHDPGPTKADSEVVPRQPVAPAVSVPVVSELAEALSPASDRRKSHLGKATGRTPLFGNLPSWWGDEDAPQGAGRHQQHASKHSGSEDDSRSSNPPSAKTGNHYRPKAVDIMPAPPVLEKPLRMDIAPSVVSGSIGPTARRSIRSDAMSFNVDFGGPSKQRGPNLRRSLDNKSSAAQRLGLVKDSPTKSQARRGGANMSPRHQPPQQPASARPGGVKAFLIERMMADQQAYRNSRQYGSLKRNSSLNDLDDIASECGTYIIERENSNEPQYQQPCFDSRSVSSVDSDRTPSPTLGVIQGTTDGPVIGPVIVPSGLDESKSLLRQQAAQRVTSGGGCSRAIAKSQAAALAGMEQRRAHSFVRESSARNAAVIKTAKTPPASRSAKTRNQPAAAFGRTDGGRFSMRTAAAAAPPVSEKSKAQKEAWLRRKQYNPMAAAAGAQPKKPSEVQPHISAQRLRREFGSSQSPSKAAASGMAFTVDLDAAEADEELVVVRASDNVKNVMTTRSKSFHSGAHKEELAALAELTGAQQDYATDFPEKSVSPPTSPRVLEIVEPLPEVEPVLPQEPAEPVAALQLQHDLAVPCAEIDHASASPPEEPTPMHHRDPAEPLPTAELLARADSILDKYRRSASEMTGVTEATNNDAIEPIQEEDVEDPGTTEVQSIAHQSHLRAIEALTSDLVQMARLTVHHMNTNDSTDDSVKRRLNSVSHRLSQTPQLLASAGTAGATGLADESLSSIFEQLAVARDTLNEVNYFLRHSADSEHTSPTHSHATIPRSTTSEAVSESGGGSSSSFKLGNTLQKMRPFWDKRSTSVAEKK